MENNISGWVITTIRQKIRVKKSDLNFWYSNPIWKLYKKGKQLGIDIQILTPEEITLFIDSSGEWKVFANDEEQELPNFIIPRTGAGTNNTAMALYLQLEMLVLQGLSN